VVDLEPVTALFGQVFGAEPRSVANDGPETIADFDIGDLTVRVIAPHGASSDWHGVVANGRGTLHSVTLAVDLQAAPTGLEAAGIRFAADDPDSLRLDSSDTFGIRLYLVDQG